MFFITGPCAVCLRRFWDIARVLQGHSSRQGRRAKLEESHLQDHCPSRRASSRVLPHAQLSWTLGIDCDDDVVVDTYPTIHFIMYYKTLWVATSLWPSSSSIPHKYYYHYYINIIISSLPLLPKALHIYIHNIKDEKNKFPIIYGELLKKKKKKKISHFDWSLFWNFRLFYSINFWKPRSRALSRGCLLQAVSLNPHTTTNCFIILFQKQVQMESHIKVLVSQDAPIFFLYYYYQVEQMKSFLST